MGTGGLVFIAFLIRVTVNAIRKLAGIGWPVRPAKIVSARYRGQNWGCDYTEYRYKYSVDGVLFQGIYRLPYLQPRVKDAQKSGSIGAEVKVRVCPGNPARSVLMGY